jgi:hypothetical protein
VLTGHRQRLPAGRDHPYARRRGEQVADEPGGRFEQVLAVVEDQQQLLVPEVGAQPGGRLGRSLVAQAEGGHDGVADQGRIPQLRELDQPGATPETPAEVGRDPDRQAGLAHTTRAYQADQPRARQLLPDFGQLTAAADETGRLGGQVARPTRGCGHGRKVPRRRGAFQYRFRHSTDGSAPRFF